MAVDPLTLWHPVASVQDVPYRHVFQGQLLGRELAIWRADDDFVNVWENRCLHRGVRLSIGLNDGYELRCQYHGWRYANRSAGCVYIPAHPADAPARTICNRTFPSVERYGLIWSGEEPSGDPPVVPRLESGRTLGLRNLPVNASVELTLQHLKTHRFQPVDRLAGESARMSVETADDYSITLTADQGGSRSTVVFFVQPVDSHRSVIRGVLADTRFERRFDISRVRHRSVIRGVLADTQAADHEIAQIAEIAEIAVFRHHSTALARLIESIEADAARQPKPKPMTPKIEQVSLELARLPDAPSGRAAALRVVVGRKWETAEGVAGFLLEPTQGHLPTYQPGAHIDVHLPNGLIRQYSITNGPGEGAYYRIGVKLEPDSSGGSKCLHKTVREGDVLAISEPRNNFSLRRDSVRTILIAGGIGITPLIAMAQALKVNELAFELHYFAQTEGHLAFGDVLDSLGDSVVRHLGLSPDDTGRELTRLLDTYEMAAHVYVCGPAPMLEATRRIAAEQGWPDDAVHFEYFKNTSQIDDSSTFEIALARSALTLQVPAGETILEVLRRSGVAVPSSCEQGACGTCLVTVLDGEPDHQDVHLNDTEKRQGDRIMTCVSRALSDRLVLDL